MSLHRPVEEDREKLGNAGRVLIAGLGDSLTYGWMVERGFFDLCVDALVEYRREVSFSRINAGVPGDTAQGGLWRLASVLAQRPAIVTVQFGLNDASSGISKDAFEASLRRIVEAVVANGALPVLVTSPPTAHSDGQEKMDPYYDAVRALAQEISCPLADIDAEWRRLEPSESASLYQADGVHPTNAGHVFMAQELLDVLDEEI